MTQNIQSLKKLLHGIVDINEQITVSGIANDSRSVKPGDLFIATVGNTVDARSLIPAAIEQGAAAIVYENADAYPLSSSLLKSIPAYPISNLNVWQGVIASRFFENPSQNMQCVGVTGTNGKTSCTQWIAQALSHHKIQCGLVGTLGYGFPGALKKTGYTTPDPILLQAELAEMERSGAKVIAMETSSHALVQHRLNGVEFDVAVLTQISRDHLDFHGSMDNYKAAKKLLFQSECLKAAVMNIDDPIGAEWAQEFSKSYPVITYSLQNKQALIHATRIEPTLKGFQVDVSTPWGKDRFQIPFLGKFNISNVFAVLGVLGHFEIPFHQALHSLESLQPVSGRMEMLGGQDQPSVVVDFAHTPDALKNVLDSLRAHCQGELWCVFGCGGDRDRGKRSEMAKIAELYSDRIVVTNDNPRTESPERIVDDIMAGFSTKKAVVEMDRAQAIAYAVANAANHDTVLVAGKGHEEYQILGKEVLPFSDAEQIRKALARRDG